MNTLFSATKNKDKYILLLLFLSALVFRVLSFFYSVIDHDESTYLIISNELNQGAQLYKDVIDTKPVGVFALLSAFQLLFGKSILAVRILGTLILSGTAFFLYKIYGLMGLKRKLAILGSIFYIIVFSAYRFGLAFNTELVFTFFSVAGLYYLLIAINQDKLKIFFSAGLLVGLGFMVKYYNIAGFTAFVLTTMLLLIQQKRWKSTISGVFFLSIGFLVPFMLTHLYFYIIGNYDEFYYITFEVSRNYISNRETLDALKFISDFHLKYLHIVLLYYWALFKSEIPYPYKFLSMIWYGLVWMVMLIAGKDFNHYYLQLLPPLFLVLPFFVKQYLKDKYFNKVFGAAIGIGFLMAVINQSYFWTNKDSVRSMARDLKGQVDESDLIFSGPKSHLVYYLLDLKPPSKYVHPTLIFQHAESLSLTTKEEMNKILEQHPKFIVHRKGDLLFESHKSILNRYSFFQSYGKFKVLKMNN